MQKLELIFLLVRLIPFACYLVPNFTARSEIVYRITFVFVAIAASIDYVLVKHLFGPLFFEEEGSITQWFILVATPTLWLLLAFVNLITIEFDYFVPCMVGLVIGFAGIKKHVKENTLNHQQLLARLASSSFVKSAFNKAIGINEPPRQASM